MCVESSVESNRRMDANNEINFRSLQRYDQSVESILTSATQVAVYNYVSNDWSKLDIEGALFVVSKGANNYGLIIMNRLNRNNFNEVIDRKWEVKLNLPFLLYKNDKGDIRCVWFYDQADCKRVYTKLREIMTDDTNNVATVKNGFDLSKLNTSASNNSSGVKVEETLAKLGIKQPQQTAVNDTDQFMRSLIQQTNQKLVLNNDSSETTQSPTIFTDKSLPNLPSTPGTLSRTLNLQELFNSTSKPSVITNLSNSFLEKAADVKTPVKSRMESLCNAESIGGGGDLVLTPALLKQNGTSLNDGQLSPPILSSAQPEQLYRPTPTTQFNSTNEFVSPFQTKLASSLNQQSPSVLTMEQLKQTMIHLLTNDADFLHTIHTAYKQSVQNKFN